MWHIWKRSMDGRRKCSKAVDLFFLEFQRGMKIVFKRDFQIGVSQNFAERFGIHAICDTAGGKRVPDMEIAIGKMNIFPTQGAEFSNPQPCIESQIDDGFGDSCMGS